MSSARALSWQINLLDERLAESARSKPRITVLKAFAIGLAVAGALYYTQTLRESLGERRMQASLAEARLAKVQQAAGSSAGTHAARQQALQSLESEVAREQALLAALSAALAGGGTRWTATSVLTTLSDLHPPGLWLTRIQLDRSRQEVTLEGMAADARAVSAYLEGLGRGNSALARLAVSSVKAERETAAAEDKDASVRSALRFSLQSKPEPR